jgi:hypothetical protein
MWTLMWYNNPCHLTAETSAFGGGRVVVDYTSLLRSVWVRSGVMGWMGNKHGEPCAHSDVVVAVFGSQGDCQTYL